MNELWAFNPSLHQRKQRKRKDNFQNKLILNILFALAASPFIFSIMSHINLPHVFSLTNKIKSWHCVA